MKTVTNIIYVAFTVFALACFGLAPTAQATTPTLGNYPNTSIPLSSDTTLTPDATPTNTTSINVSSSTNFKGKL